MARLIGEHWEGDVRVRWWGDEATKSITIERSHDVEGVIDMVAAENAEGLPVHDGIGSSLGRIDPILAEAYCTKRGIDVAKFLYGTEYADELKRFLKEHNKFAHKYTKTVHTVQ